MNAYCVHKDLLPSVNKYLSATYTKGFPDPTPGFCFWSKGDTFITLNLGWLDQWFLFSNKELSIPGVLMPAWCLSKDVPEDFNLREFAGMLQLEERLVMPDAMFAADLAIFLQNGTLWAFGFHDADITPIQEVMEFE